MMSKSASLVKDALAAKEKGEFDKAHKALKMAIRYAV